MSDWKGPLGRRFVIGYSVGGLIVVLISIATYAITENVYPILFAGVVAAPVWLIPILGYYHFIRSVWSSVYTHSKQKHDVVIERIVTALNDADMEFARTDTDTRWSKRTVLDLRPMEIVADKLLTGTRVYVGPVMEGEPADVERLKGLVDEALG